MTKTDRSGIVTRNCATIIKSEEGCEEDAHGDILCYCLTDFCNGAGREGSLGVAVLAAAVVVAVRGGGGG